jgi:hypothetical protein
MNALVADSVGRQRARLLAVALAAVAVLLAVLAVTRAGQPEGPTFDAEELLAQARAAAPYELKFPETVPAGLTLHNVIWGGADPEDDPGSSAFYADIWFLDEDGSRLHVWQTNMPDITNDPTTRPDARPESIDGRVWMFERLELGDSSTLQLSRRFADGILVTVDYQRDGELLREIASALQ